MNSLPPVHWTGSGTRFCASAPWRSVSSLSSAGGETARLSCTVRAPLDDRPHVITARGRRSRGHRARPAKSASVEAAKTLFAFWLEARCCTSEEAEHASFPCSEPPRGRRSKFGGRQSLGYADLALHSHRDTVGPAFLTDRAQRSTYDVDGDGVPRNRRKADDSCREMSGGSP
jgi:hypothetical protein